MLVIDGARGEGGGQVVRTSLALALVTGTAVRVENVRARRRMPGLMRQHLAALRAAATVGRAEVAGDEVGSRTVELRPRGVVAGEHVFRVGTAGSATLVLQTVLPALVRADGPSRLVLEGGTHNPKAPTFDFLARAYLPLVEKMGARGSATLERHGFYPAGGGRFVVEVEPARDWKRLDLDERGAIVARRATALLAKLPHHIAARELATLHDRLGGDVADFRAVEVHDSLSPGNVVSVEYECAHVTELFTAMGERGVRAETVAARAADEAQAWLDAGVPVGQHLADQLVLAMAIAGGGSFRTLAPTAHTTTQVDVIGAFLGDVVRWEMVSDKIARFDVAGYGKSMV